MSRTTQKFVVDEAGRTTAVLISIKRYERLMEDLHDLSVIAERREEETLSLADVKARLRDARPIC